MTDARGHVEKLGRCWYLRTWRKVADPLTGEVALKQRRVPLGSTRDIRSKAQARHAADRWLAKLAPSTLQPGPRVRFVQFSEKFATDHVARFKPSSRRRYLGIIRLLQQAFGSDTLPAINTSRLQAVVTTLGRNRSPATVKAMRAVALQILRRARTEGFGAHVIVTRDIKLPKTTAPKTERPSWTAAELERMLAASYGPWRALWAAMAYAGLRCGEAFGLTWSDVDLGSSTLHIRRSATRAGMTSPKTATSAASVPMLPRLVDLMTEYRGAWRPNAAGLLFATRTGKPLSADTVRARQWAKLLARLGLPHAGLHSLRHSTPRLLAAMGLSIDVIRVFMRHSDLRMTEHYLHTSADDVRTALSAAIAREQVRQGPTGVAEA